MSSLGLNMFMETNVINPSHVSLPNPEDYIKNGSFDFSYDSHDEYGNRLILNSDGHRGPEFFEGVDILGAGCSHTYGMGLPEDVTWIKVVSEKNNKTYNNLSFRGGSPFFIVENIFKYFRKYGHPKKVFCIFPDFYRVRTYVDKKIILSRSENNFDPAKITMPHPTNARGIKDIDSIDKYVKIPTFPEKIFSLEFTGMLNLISISMLEQYCRSNKINLVWTIWSHGDKEFFEYCEKYFDYYMEATDDILDMAFHQSCSKHKTTQENIHENYPCHSDVRNSISEYFDISMDKDHFGAHWHIHVADFFERFL